MPIRTEGYLGHVHHGNFAGFGVISVNKGDIVSVALTGLTSRWGSQIIKHPVS